MNIVLTITIFSLDKEEKRKLDNKPCNVVSDDINVQKAKGTAVWGGETKVILSFFINTWSKNKGSAQPSYC